MANNGRIQTAVGSEQEPSTPWVNLDRKRHQKFREQKGNAAFQMIRGLTRLPPREKKKIVVSQLRLILTYGAELHSKLSKRGMLLAAEWNRFVTGGWRGSSRE